jgi:hypothetical protein
VNEQGTALECQGHLILVGEAGTVEGRRQVLWLCYCMTAVSYLT